MTAFFRPARTLAAIVSTSALLSFALPASALDASKPSLRASSSVVTVKDVPAKKRTHYRKRHYHRDTVYAPFTRVERGRRHTTVDAPFAHVHNGPRGKRVVAPFVDLWIPR